MGKTWLTLSLPRVVRIGPLEAANALPILKDFSWFTLSESNREIHDALIFSIQFQIDGSRLELQACSVVGFRDQFYRAKLIDAVLRAHLGIAGYFQSKIVRV